MKLDDSALRDLKRLGKVRLVRAVDSVTQLVDDPEQAAELLLSLTFTMAGMSGMAVQDALKARGAHRPNVDCYADVLTFLAARAGFETRVVEKQERKP